MRPALLLMIALLALPAAALTPVADEVSDTVVVVVRHAEKAADDPKDPGLTEAGQARARALAKALAQAGVKAVYATQYRRTRLTGEPTAAANGVEVQVRTIDAGNSANYAGELKAHLLATHAGQTVLVVGHSNTAPDIVAALSGQPVVAMPETEYDRFVVVSLGPDGQARVVTSRY